MPERWQNELRRLRDLEPSTDLWRRAEEGPQVPGGPNFPPRRQRLVAGIVAFSVFIAAGAFAWRILRPPGATVGGAPTTVGTVVATVTTLDRGGASIPTASLRFGGQTILGEVTTDATDRPFQSEDPWWEPRGEPHEAGPIIVAVGSVLVASGDAESVDAELQQAGPGGIRTVVSVDGLSDPVVLDHPPGRFVLRLTGHWPQGDASFYFSFDLAEEGGVTLGSTKGEATLSIVGKNAPGATLAYQMSQSQQVGLRTRYTWCEDSTGCVDGVADFATYPPPVEYLPIPAGTGLRIYGDATAIAGVFLREGSGEGGADLAAGAIPGIPGRYVLQLDVLFDRGDATFFLGIEATSTS